MRSTHLLALAAALAWSVPAPSAARAAIIAAATPPLFGTGEAFSPDNSAFFKWNGMLERFRAEERRCQSDASDACIPREWRALLDEVRGLDLRDKIERVNATVNRHPYVPSLQNWGESNHWEPPFEFFRKSGQCQDFAIAKYFLLRAAGVPAERLRVVVLRDMRLGLDHSVTVAFVDGDAWVLDNQQREIRSSAALDHYRPYYSINEEGWWLHRGMNARYAAAAGKMR